LSYPLYRTDNFGATLNASVEVKRMTDFQVTTPLSNKSVHVATIGIGISSEDKFWGGGRNTGTFTITQGSVDLSGNAQAYAADQAAGRVNGSFMKLAATASREQKFGSTLTLLLHSRAQVTNRNLDGSEQIAFGGGDSLRGYPVSQMAGDLGVLGSAEMQWKVRPTLNLSSFYEIALIKQHANPWSGSLSSGVSSNIYSLQSVGAGLAWKPFSSMQLRAIGAWAIGGSSVNTASAGYSGNTIGAMRIWVDASLSF
jgi:hemolysin activation/secretion protein